MGKEQPEPFNAEEKLKQIADEWQSTFDAITDPVMFLDRDFRIVRANKATVQFLGLPFQSVIGKHCYKLIHGSERPPNFCPLAKMIPANEHQETEFFDSGKGRWFFVSVDPISDKDEKLTGVVHIVKDISERKHWEEILRESENKFRDLTEKSLAGVYLIQDGFFKYVNPRFAEIHGYTVEEIIDQKRPSDFPLPEDLHIVTDVFRKKISGEGDSLQFEFRILTRQKKIRHVEAYGSRTIYKGKPAFIGTLLDITERRRAQEALLESEAKYRNVVENTLMGFYIIQDNLFRFVNQRFCDILGYTYEEIVDRISPLDLTYLEDKDMIEENMKKRLTGNKLTGAYELRTVRKDGQVIPLKIFGGSMNYNGRPAIIGTIIDISREKILEAQLRQAEKMQAIGTLAGGLAHDFNNLLMTILGYTSLLLLDITQQDPNYEKLKIIESQVQSGADLTKQLLGFARGGKYEVKPTNLNTILINSSELFGRTKKEIRIFRNLTENLWTTEVDQSQIEQVFLNLLVNAWQAMPGGGEIYLETSNFQLDEHQTLFSSLPPGEYVKISITDTGIGMDEGTKQRIFEPFFTTKELGRGSGLGLASTYGIIKNHNGTINVYSEKGKGSTFTVYLPAIQKAVVEEKKGSVELLKGSETILLVDDQEDVIKVGKAILEKLGYRVLLANSGDEALQIYKTRYKDIDLIILDMVMPVMSGGETYSRMKEINPNLKTILSSGYSLNGQATKIIEKGCDGFIQKPFTVSTLSQKIREVLD